DLVAYGEGEQQHLNDKTDAQGVVRQRAQGLPSDSEILAYLIYSAERNKRIGHHKKPGGHILSDEIIVDAGVKDYQEGYDFNEAKFEQVRPHREAQCHEKRPPGKHPHEEPVKETTGVLQVEYQGGE